jgi:tRNA pseudouridine32 synthase/23S rRNA pseudouridine746 synthase
LELPINKGILVEKQEFHIPVELDGKTAVELLATASKHSKQKIKQAMQKGCVWLEKSSEHKDQKQYIQRLRRAKKMLSIGETLHFYYDENVLNTESAEAVLISDSKDYSIWDKPRGMLSQGSKWGDHCTINRWAEKHLKPERPAFIVHRLDRAASGLIIIAHKKQVASSFGTLFQQHKIEKQYRVSVEGDFSTLLESSNTVKTVNSEIDNKSAVSHCRFIAYDKSTNESVLTVEIETGRKHQIRKHLSGLGFPVVGDRLYGSGENKKDLKLRAVLLRFICPVSGEERLFEL